MTGWEEARQRHEVEREVLYTVAGDVAEREAGGRCEGSTSDLVQVAELLGHRCRTEQESKAYMRWLYERAFNLVRWHRLAVEAIAKALIEEKTIKRAELRRIALKADLLQRLPAKRKLSDLPDRQLQGRLLEQLKRRWASSPTTRVRMEWSLRMSSTVSRRRSTSPSIMGTAIPSRRSEVPCDGQAAPAVGR
jgi:hypothetical protein